MTVDAQLSDAQSEAGMVRSPVRTRNDATFYGGRGVFTDDWFDGDSEGGLETWAVPWSDLMMTMFVLFVVLVSAHGLLAEVEISTEYEQLPVPQPVPEPYEVERLVEWTSDDADAPLRINVFALSQQAVRDTNLSEVEIALLDDQSVKVSVQGPMLFDRGRAELKNDMRAFLERLAAIISETPYVVHIVGHTDDRPINTSQFPSNWELSLVRASRVARFLIEAGNFDPARFIVMGRGQYAPTVPNSDDRARALNRRVEIIVTRTVSTTETRALL